MAASAGDIPFRLSHAERLLLDLLLVPPAPQPPEGDPASLRVFRAGQSYYVWCLITWAAATLFVLASTSLLSFALWQAMQRSEGWAGLALGVLILIIWTVALLTVLVGLVSRRLNYGLRWYIVTDRSLRIRSGIFVTEELTMTYGNVQEIRVTAGPIQHVLGLANVEVHAAGGASDPTRGGGGHIGRFSGVSNANEIRDLITERLRRYRDAGLGDTAHVAGDTASDHDALEAARAVLREAQALRTALLPKPPAP